jgi:hypothetical protein
MDLETAVRNIIELLAFHDERAVRNWLYHGFVLCELGRFPTLRDELINAKKEARCTLDKRIHFSQLTSSSAGSSRTRTAVKWAELFVKKLYGSMWFYLFGINLNNIDYQLFGSSADGQDRDSRIYNRFFEIGLFAACRYFFDPATEDVEILQIFSEKRELEKKDPFATHAPYKINKRETNVVAKSRRVIEVASTLSREKDYPECVDMVNFVDVLAGAFSQIIDFTSRSRGCAEVADKLFPVCRRLSEDPYNKNSRYYKRYAMSFFPKVKQSKSKIISYSVKPPEQQFYSRRTLRLYQPKCIPGFEKLAG